jgi:hypothetical protein
MLSSILKPQSAFSQRNKISLADDQMIKEFNVQQIARLR